MRTRQIYFLVAVLLTGPAASAAPPDFTTKVVIKPRAKPGDPNRSVKFQERTWTEKTVTTPEYVHRPLLVRPRRHGPTAPEAQIEDWSRIANLRAKLATASPTMRRAAKAVLDEIQAVRAQHRISITTRQGDDGSFLENTSKHGEQGTQVSTLHNPEIDHLSASVWGAARSASVSHTDQVRKPGTDEWVTAANELHVVDVQPTQGGRRVRHLTSRPSAPGFVEITENVSTERYLNPTKADRVDDRAR